MTIIIIPVTILDIVMDPISIKDLMEFLFTGVTASDVMEITTIVLITSIEKVPIYISGQTDYISIGERINIGVVTAITRKDISLYFLSQHAMAIWDWHVKFKESQR